MDSGASENFISRQAAQEAGLLPLAKKQSYPLHVANGSRMPHTPTITHEVTAILQIQEHRETIVMDVLNGSKHDIVLGLP